MAELNQLSGPYAKFFVCGLCEKLAVRPQVHDGGYGQDFCQKVFCEVCVGVRSENPVYQRLGRYGGYETICPSPNCRINFKPPYFRKLGIIERICYNNLTVSCRLCEKRYEVFNYLAHSFNCKGKVVPSTSQALPPVKYGDISRLVPTMANKSTMVTLINNEKLRLVSNNMMRWKNSAPESLVDMYFRTLGNDFQYMMPTDISVKDALNILAKLRNHDADSIDVVYIGHVSIRQFNTVADFLKVMPDCSDFNLVCYSRNFHNPKTDLRLQISAAHPQRITADDSNDLPSTLVEE